MSSIPPEDALIVYDGNVARGMWMLVGDYLGGPDHTLINVSKIVVCSVISDRNEVNYSRSGRIAGGLIGAALVGPLGAVAGLMTGGKTTINETLVRCTFDDGRSLDARLSRPTLAKLQHAIQLVKARSIVQQTQIPPKVEVPKVNSKPSHKANSEYVECPICAENIKPKAIKCRFCGHDRKAQNSTSSPAIGTDSWSTLSLDSLVSKYLSEYSDSALTQEIIQEILEEFSKNIKHDPHADYRERAELVKQALGITSIVEINNLTREVFPFIRKSTEFEIKDRLIILKRNG